VTNIIVNGIPGTDKTKIVQKVQELYKDNLEKDISSISLGDMFADMAWELFKTDPKRVAYTHYSIKQALRVATIERVLNQLLNYKENKEEPLIFDTPITMYAQGGAVPNIVRPFSDFSKLNKARNIDAIVTLIDAPEKVAERLRDTPYAKESDELLDWMGFEAEIAKSYAISLSQHKSTSNLVDYLVIPRQNSEISLVKLIHDYETKDRDSTVIYAGGPISHLQDESKDSEIDKRKKAKHRKKMDDFTKQLQYYGVIISPIKIADISKTPKHEEHTKHRDLNYFIPYSNIFIAYFPDDYESKGTEEEMRHALTIGKPVILIHPTEQDKVNEVFRTKPTIHFENEEIFFNTIKNIESSKLSETQKRVLRMFLENEKPKYNMFENIINEHYK